MPGLALDSVSELWHDTVWVAFEGECAVLVYLYITGMPLFTFLAWVFSEAFQAGETVHLRVRIPLVIASGVVWPVLLVGVAQIQVLRIRAKLMTSHTGPPICVSR